MSKQFEEEYKALADREAPDLWARIEAGLAPRSATPGDMDVKEVKVFQLFLKRYGKIAAAVVCAAILLPSALLVNRIGQKSYSVSDAGAYDAAAEAPQITMGTSDEELEEAALAVMDEMADMDETAGVDEMTDEAPAMEEPACEAAADEDAVSTTQAERAVQASVKEKAADLKYEKGAEVLEDIVVKVVKNLGTDLTEKEEELDRMGTVYRVEIIEDASGALEKGTEVDVLLSALSSAHLTEGESCRMRLQREEDCEAFAYRILEWQEEPAG